MNDAQPTRWLDLLMRLDADVNRICRDIAQTSPISARSLRTALYLHLPRFAVEAILNNQTLSDEAKRLSTIMVDKQSSYLDWNEYPKIQEFDRHDIVFREVNDDIAQTIYERFHYLSTCREGLVHLGLFHRATKNVPMAILTLSAMDIKHLSYQFDDKCNQALVVSRSFAFDWAPRNSISFMMAQVRRWVNKKWPPIATLITYVNPNLGFTGSSYVASGWRVAGWKDILYRYFRDQYVTYRSAEQLSDQEKLEIRRSSMPLAPLTILTVNIKSERDRPRGFISK